MRYSRDSYCVLLLWIARGLHSLELTFSHFTLDGNELEERLRCI